MIFIRNKLFKKVEQILVHYRLSKSYDYMKLSSLTAISPIDGRYSDKLIKLRTIFSEFGLLKFRVQVEICWLQKLASCDKISEIPPFDDKTKSYLEKIFTNFSIKDAERIKTIEHNINHDVKAVEYFLKEKFSTKPKLIAISEFIHFACTSEDINNLSYALMLISARKDIILPTWKKIIKSISLLAKNYRDIPMLSRTHGQPATPSTIGKEMANFAYRMTRQYYQLKQLEILGKINGAVGNYNAHMIAYPEVDWLSFSEEFVTELNINWNPLTTQIEPHDYIAEILNCIIRFNNIVIDFNRDIWGYITLNYFKQRITTSEVGSSTMPHKINPIDFENSEGNLGMANAVMNHLSIKLPLSRWQRDLTDSTVLRNLGVGISHAMIAYQATLKGISKLKINKKHLLKELYNSWEVLAEPIQVVMRRYGIKESYEKLKKFTRSKYVSSKSIKAFIDNSSLPDQEKIKLKTLTPANYTGYASIIVDKLNK